MWFGGFAEWTVYVGECVCLWSSGKTCKVHHQSIYIECTIVYIYSEPVLICLACDLLLIVHFL